MSLVSVHDPAIVVASSSCQRSYDVFLNFRGKDTRNGFTAHLYEALHNYGIKTFMDADGVAKGEKISPALVTAIEKSMFSIVVLSKNYASSTWCLEELVKILDCKNTMGQTVLPIFYQVDPSDVRRQKGSFAKAFAKHEQKLKEMVRVQIWKEALTEVASLSGWDSRHRPESMLIKEIVGLISNSMICRSSKDTELAINGKDVLTIGIFQQHHHKEVFMKLSSHVIEYINVGSLLSRKSKLKWRSELMDNESQSEENEQLSRSIQEDLIYTYPPPFGNESIYQAIPFPVLTGFKICAGCGTEIILRRYLKCIGKVWHPECFRCHACKHPISDYEFFLSGESPYHKSCYKEKCRQKCDVCGHFFWANPACLMEDREHPFWVQKYCPSHKHDGTPSCFSCERKEPWDTRYTTLKDGRKLCLECLDHAIMDTHEYQPLYLNVQRFCESLNIVVGQQVPLLLVERQSPSESTGREKSSTLVDMIKEPYKGVPGFKLTTFRILHGLPRLLTGAILAHLMMRVWLQLQGRRSLTQHAEGGICQVLAYMWLNTELMSRYGSDIASTSSSMTLPSPSRQGTRSKFERKFGEFLKYMIESDTSVYGDGFRAGYRSVLRHGLGRIVDHILMTGRFPDTPDPEFR
eukprot:XP_010665311.2 PREDICTED: protein DA1-related 1-like [Vitis vinifera]